MIILIEDYITRDPGFLYETITESIEKGMRLVLNFRNINKLNEEYIVESIGRVIDEHDFESIKLIVIGRDSPFRKYAGIEYLMGSLVHGSRQCIAVVRKPRALLATTER